MSNLQAKVRVNPCNNCTVMIFASPQIQAKEQALLDTKKEMKVMRKELKASGSDPKAAKYVLS